MHRGLLLRIILIVLILGMSAFLIMRNNVLHKRLDAGEISEIKAKDFLPFGSGTTSGLKDIFGSIIGGNDEVYTPPKRHIKEIASNAAGMKIVLIEDEIAGPIGTNNGVKQYEYIKAIRYVSRENGYVYDYVPKYSKSYLRSDTPIPRISFAHFGQDGNQILFQYLDKDLVTEKSVLGVLGNSNVFLLPDNTPSFAFGPKGSFAYMRRSNEGAVLMVRDSLGKESAVYSSPLTEWNMDFMGPDKILLTTKASEKALGFSYILDLNSKKISRLFGDAAGLTTKVSPGGGYILKAETVSSGPVMSLYNVRTKNLVGLGKMGMVEKCDFRSDDTAFTCAFPKSFESRLYPDSWYLGEVSTNDELAQYTTENLNEKTFTSLMEEIGEEVNVWQLSVDTSGTLAAFINRNNMSLWLYEE